MPVYVEDLKAWPPLFERRQVLVKGVLRREHREPKFVDAQGRVLEGGLFGDIYFIKPISVYIALTR
jgi:hypothetical protein